MKKEERDRVEERFLHYSFHFTLMYNLHLSVHIYKFNILSLLYSSKMFLNKICGVYSHRKVGHKDNDDKAVADDLRDILSLCQKLQKIFKQADCMVSFKS